MKMLATCFSTARGETTRARAMAVVAYLAAAACFRSQLTERLGHVPLLDLIAILAGLPAIAAAAGWVFGGREPRSNAGPYKVKPGFHHARGQ
jgi:hypothetical protein